jgi:DUF917 family protein
MTPTLAAGDAARLTEIGADCTALSRGAAILGSGGGGDPYIGRLLAESAIRARGPVPVVALDEVPDDAVVVAVAMMGAPTVMLEKLPSAEQFAAAVHALAEYRHIAPTHIVCIEIGGVNSTSPIVAAAELGLPVVDADGMGRAFPEIQMVLPTLYGLSAAPMAVADEKGNQLIVDTIDNTWAERLSRTAVVEMGCSAITAQYALSGAELKRSFVPGGLSLCNRLGIAIEAARAQNRDPVSAAAEVLGGRILGAGKVVDIERRTAAGFARGVAHIVGTDAGGAVDIELSFQNEHLLVTRNGRVETTAPDLIIVLDTETGEPITTEALRYGQRVRVVTAPADPRWHSPQAHRLVGPEYFHYESAPIRFDGTEAS